MLTEALLDDYAWHTAALAGTFGDLERGVAPCGFYRLRQRDGSFAPLAIWRDGPGGPVLGQVGTEPPQAADEAFCERTIAWCSRDPISEELYWAVREGAPWPDAPPEREATFSNLPADPYEAARLEIEAESDEIDRWLMASPIRDQTACDRAANWSTKLADLEKRVGALRVEAKRPHDEAARAAQAKWKPLEDQAADLKRRLKDAQQPFLVAKRREEVEARAAAAQVGEAIGPAKTTGAGTMGRKSSLRTERRAEIVDFAAAFAAVKDHPDLRALVQTLADRAARNGGMALPGCRIVTTERVA